MNQREFWDWYHKEYVPAAREYCHAEYGELGPYRLVEILDQCRTLFNYEGACYSYTNFQAIFEGWANDFYRPDLLMWVENDRKKHGVWKGRIETVP